jgi:hypothetical protein
MEVDLPSVYRTADRAAAAAQHEFFLLTKARLAAFIVAPIPGLVTSAGVESWINAVSLTAFLVALIVEVALLSRRPERTWYEARAAAESVKTLAWRYAMGGQPFAISRPTSEVDTQLIVQTNEVLQVLKHLDLEPDWRPDSQITDWMRKTRSFPLERRKATYQEGRVGDQQLWYRNQAQWNATRAKIWSTYLLCIELIGAVVASLRLSNVISVNPLGILAAAGAVGVAWIQAKRYQDLAAAYTVTALELASLRSKIDRQASEDDWVRFIDDAEEAFSREHTLWKASRGIESY